jgi:hypothetical protein
MAPTGIPCKRQVPRVRRRLGRAARYLDGLLDELGRASRGPWPGKLTCPVRGAPIDQARPEYRAGDSRGLVLVHQRVNGNTDNAGARMGLEEVQ